MIRDKRKINEVREWFDTKIKNGYGIGITLSFNQSQNGKDVNQSTKQVMIDTKIDDFITKLNLKYLHGQQKLRDIWKKDMKRGKKLVGFSLIGQVEYLKDISFHVHGYLRLVSYGEANNKLEALMRDIWNETTNGYGTIELSKKKESDINFNKKEMIKYKGYRNKLIECSLTDNIKKADIGFFDYFNKNTNTNGSNITTVQSFGYCSLPEVTKEKLEQGVSLVKWDERNRYIVNETETIIISEPYTNDNEYNERKRISVGDKIRNGLSRSRELKNISSELLIQAKRFEEEQRKQGNIDCWKNF